MGRPPKKLTLPVLGGHLDALHLSGTGGTGDDDDVGAPAARLLHHALNNILLGAVDAHIHLGKFFGHVDPLLDDIHQDDLTAPRSLAIMQ